MATCVIISVDDLKTKSKKQIIADVLQHVHSSKGNGPVDDDYVKAQRHDRRGEHALAFQHYLISATDAGNRVSATVIADYLNRDLLQTGRRVPLAMLWYARALRPTQGCVCPKGFCRVDPSSACGKTAPELVTRESYYFVQARALQSWLSAAVLACLSRGTIFHHAEVWFSI